MPDLFIRITGGSRHVVVAAPEPMILTLKEFRCEKLLEMPEGYVVVF